MVRARGADEKPLLPLGRLQNSCLRGRHLSAVEKEKCVVGGLHAGCAKALRASWPAYSIVYNSTEEERGTFRKLHKFSKAERGARRRTQQDMKLKGRLQITMAL